MMMFMFLLLVSLASALIHGDVNSTLLAIDNLHKKTPYSTFYEVLGVSENTSMARIRKRFQLLMRNPGSLRGVNDQNEAVALLTEAYNILRTKKSTYDSILANSYFYMGNRENFRNNLFIVLFSVFLGLIALDLIYFGVKYLKFLTKPTKASRKKRTKSNHHPSMLSMSLIRSIKSLVKK